MNRVWEGNLHEIKINYLLCNLIFEYVIKLHLQNKS